MSYRLFALFLAFEYLAFHTEPFDEEYEKNNPQRTAGVSLDYPAGNWESFGKASVREAFSFDCSIPILLLLLRIPAIGRELPSLIPFCLLRNKAPPPCLE